MTTNLLRGDWTTGQIEAILVEVPRRPLLPPLGSDEWRRVARHPHLASTIMALRKKADKESGTALPELTDDLYGHFHRTGERLPFERLYFERRRQLACAAVALLLCDDGDPGRQLLQEAMLAKLTGIFEEVSWTLPAHVRTEIATGKDPLRIDLFCAETANLMAEMIDLFGAILPPDLQLRIRERLRRDIFDNYRNRHREMEWPTAGMNWNAVCHQGVIGAALSQLDDPRLLAELLMLTRGFLPIFLQGFTPDGGCSEGPAYWGYGFGWFAVLNEQLETRTGGRLSLVEGDDHIRAIARFGPLTSLPDQKFVNFSDGAPDGILNPSLLRYLGDRLGDSLYHRASAENYKYLTQTGIDLDAQRSDLFYLARLFLRWPEQIEHGVVEPEDIFLPDLGVLVAHGKDRQGHRWNFAAKGGHNAEHHNHNDCGSYLLNIDGVRVIAEIGAAEYVADYFGAKRYEFLATRTLGHSLPIINGIEQAAGEAFRSRILHHHLGDDLAELRLDLTACYPEAALCRKLVRTFVFDKRNGRLGVSDEFELIEAKSMETSVITIHPVVLFPEHIVIHAGQHEWAVRPDKSTVLDKVEKHFYNAHRTGAPAWVHRIVWKPAALSASGRVAYDIESNVI